MNNGWIYFFCYKGRRACSETSRCQVQSPQREAFSLHQVQINCRIHYFRIYGLYMGSKANQTRPRKRNPLRSPEYKGTLLALYVPEP